MSGDTIRRDLYAVKERDGSLGPQWCYVLITTDAKFATQRVREIRMDHSLGIRRNAKLVHPSQRIVDAYVLVGNTVG